MRVLCSASYFSRSIEDKIIMFADLKIKLILFLDSNNIRSDEERKSSKKKLFRIEMAF